MSNFVEIDCPSCGAAISIPKKEKSVKCMYCSATVMVQEAIKQGTGGKKAENMLKLAETAHESGNFSEAYDYYNQALEIDMENPDAWIGKGIAAVWQSTLADDRSGEMIPAFKSGFEFTSSREEKIELANKIGIAGGGAYLALVNLAANHYGEVGNFNNQRSEAAEFRNRLETYLLAFWKMIEFLEQQVNPHKWHGESLEFENLNDVHLDVHLPAELYSYFLQASKYVYGYVEFGEMGINAYGSSWRISGEPVTPLISFNDDIVMIPEDGKDHNKTTATLVAITARVKLEDVIKQPWDGKTHPRFWDFNGIHVWAALNALEKVDLKGLQTMQLYLKDPREGVELRHFSIDPDLKTGGGGCFIATASLMDESHPDLLVLRSFRDNSLSTSYLGKAFIDWYYRNGPTMAEHVKTSELLKTLVKTIVVKPMVLAVKVFKIGG